MNSYLRFGRCSRSIIQHRRNRQMPFNMTNKAKFRYNQKDMNEFLESANKNKKYTVLMENRARLLKILCITIGCGVIYVFAVNYHQRLLSILNRFKTKARGRKMTHFLTIFKNRFQKKKNVFQNFEL